MTTVDIIKSLGVIVKQVKVLPSLLHVDTSYVVDVPADHDEPLVAERANGEFYVLHGLHDVVPVGQLINVFAYKSSGPTEEKVFYTFIQNLLKQEPVATVPAPTTPPITVDINTIDFKDVI